MRLSEALVLLAAGTAAGIFSTVVAIASLVSYPVLLALGVPPLAANMTNTVALVLTGAGSVAGSRPELADQGRLVLRLGAITALGGAAGATILLLTPASTFTVVVPVLIAGASLVLLLQPKIRPLMPKARGGTGGSSPPELAETPSENLDTGHRLALGVALFAVAVYVGYFGAAAGVLLLVALTAMISEPLIRVNAIKNAVNGMANATAAACFALFGDVRWKLVAPLAAGFLIGGWIGPKIARRVPATALRVLVSLGGLGLAVKLGISAYRLGL